MDDADLLSEHLWYLEGTAASRVEVGAGEFWRQVMSGAPSNPFVEHVVGADGWLVSVYETETDSEHEEMHPHGDELHYVVHGRYDLVLAASTPGDHDTVIPLHTGECAAVPAGAWHRFVVHEPVRAVAITAGRGTEHRSHNPGGHTP